MCKTKQNAHQITSLQNRCYFFCAFFRRTKHEAGIPSPVVRVSRVSRAHRSQHEMLPFAGLKNVKKRHQFCRLSENKLLFKSLWSLVKKKKNKSLCSGKKGAAYPSEWRLTCVMPNRNTRSFLTEKCDEALGGKV